MSGKQNSDGLGEVCAFCFMGSFSFALPFLPFAALFYFLLLLALQLHRFLAIHYQGCSKLLTARPKSLLACIVMPDTLLLNRLNVGSGNRSFAVVGKVR